MCPCGLMIELIERRMCLNDHVPLTAEQLNRQWRGGQTWFGGRSTFRNVSLGKLSLQSSRMWRERMNRGVGKFLRIPTNYIEIIPFLHDDGFTLLSGRIRSPILRPNLFADQSNW